MVGLCRYCAYEQSDCKGNKDLEKLKCEYYKKRPVQNVKQMAERIAELEAEVERLRNVQNLHSGDLISRADALEQMAQAECGLHYEDCEADNCACSYIGRILNIPSAEAEPTVIRSKTLMPTKDFKEWAKRVREENQNVIVIPCDAEVVSADAEQGGDAKMTGTQPYMQQSRHDDGRMTKEEAILILGEFKEFCDSILWDSIYAERSRAIDMAIEALSAETKWIPCSERLPSNDVCVLVTIDDGIEFGKYEDGTWSIWVCEHWDEWDAKGTIAWMPLPEPYREDGEE